MKNISSSVLLHHVLALVVSELLVIDASTATQSNRLRRSIVDSGRKASRSRAHEMISFFEQQINDELPCLTQPYTASIRARTFFNVFGMARNDASISRVKDPCFVHLLDNKLWCDVSQFLWYDPLAYSKQSALHEKLVKLGVPNKGLKIVTDKIMDPLLLKHLTLRKNERNRLFTIDSECDYVSLGHNSGWHSNSLSLSLQSKASQYKHSISSHHIPLICS
jgi:hypothetical protein